MYIRIASLLALVMGAGACSAAPASGGQYETYVASLCAFDRDLWTAASDGYTIEFNYDVKTTDTGISLPGWSFKTKALVKGEPPPGGNVIRVSDKPDLINLALLSNGIRPLAAHGSPAAEKETTCSGNVCNTGPCVAVAAKNPAQIEWINLEPTNNVYSAIYNIAFDFTPYVLGWPAGGAFASCPGQDYTAVHTLIEATLQLGGAVADSAFMVEFEARLPLQKAGSSTCEDTLVTFNYQSGALVNSSFLNLVLAKREESRLEHQVRLGEGMEASLQHVHTQLSSVSTSRPEGYLIRSRALDETPIENVLTRIAGALEGVKPLAEQLGINIDTSGLQNILAALGITNVLPNQEAEALAQGLLNGQVSVDDLRNLLPGVQQEVLNSVEEVIQQFSTDRGQAETAVAQLRGWIEDFRAGGNPEDGSGAEVLTFDQEADNPYSLPVSYDGDPKNCAVKCQVDPATMAPYSECLSAFNRRFVAGFAEGMTSGTHYRAAWYPNLGTVAQVCKEVTIQRQSSEPLTKWEWQTYKVVHSNPNGYKCGDWAPSLGDVSHCPYSEANDLTCGVWSRDYCEPTQ